MNSKLVASLLVIAAITGLVQANYDETFSRAAIHYSRAAYCSYDHLDKWDCGAHCTFNKDFVHFSRINNPDRDSFGFTGYDKTRNRIIVAFRGTNGIDWTNWFTNLAIVRVSYPFAKDASVHSGFYNAWIDIQVKIRNNVKILSATYPTATIVFTGHSLGGSLAALAAADIKTWLNPPNPIAIYTFGQPRVGNQKFADFVMKLFPNNYFRVTNKRDLVPRNPTTYTWY